MYDSEKQACESAIYLLQGVMETSGRVKWACIVVASVGQQLPQLTVGWTYLRACDELRVD